jgi:hypothetical protein
MRFRPVWLAGLFIPIVIAARMPGWFDRLLDYAQPPTDPVIQQLAQKSLMTPIAERLFYRQRPTIAAQGTFLEQCQVPDKSIMLGCFVQRGHSGKIVIQNVTDPRLKGTMEVTAAHEMLHAAYERLSRNERQDVIQRLTKAASRVQDPRLKVVLDGYAAKNRDRYHNELHSHLGTELANFGDPKLEQYYQRYFTDRPRLVALAQRSGAVLKQLDDQADALKPQITQLEAELKQLEPQIKSSEAELKTSGQNLEQLEATLIATKADAESAQAYGLVAQFEQQQAQFNQAVNQHNDRAEIQRNRVANFNANVKEYKQLISKYNKVARESHSILDSLATQP